MKVLELMQATFMNLYILSTFVGMDPENKIPADIARFPAGFQLTKHLMICQ
jgi:hypothetical protein